jgi:hypothetical protein
MKEKQLEEKKRIEKINKNKDDLLEQLKQKDRKKLEEEQKKQQEREKIG